MRHLCDATHLPITEVEAKVYMALYLQTELATNLLHCPVLIDELKGCLAAWESLTKGRC
jgi:hypothetical protein